MTYSEIFLTAVAVIVGLYYAKRNFDQMNARLRNARFSLAFAAKELLILVTAVILTAVTLHFLDSLTTTPMVIFIQLLLSRFFVAFFIIAFIPTIFVLIYSFCALYYYLEKRVSHYRFEKYNLKNTDDLDSDPDFDAADTKVYTQVALVFLEEYGNPYVLRSLNTKLRKLLILRVMSQLLLTRTMKELAEETQENWDLSKVRAILYDRRFRLITRYLGLHVHLVFSMLFIMVEQQTNPIYRLIAQRSSHRRID